MVLNLSQERPTPIETGSSGTQMAPLCGNPQFQVTLRDPEGPLRVPEALEAILSPTEGILRHCDPRGRNLAAGMAQIWDNLDQFEPIWTTFDSHFDPFEAILSPF